MAFVVDNSVAMAWCFADETTPYSEAVLDRLQDTGAFVPAIWPLEAANILLLAERHGRITQAQTVRLTQFLRGLPITVDTGSLALTFGSVLELGRAYGLTSYDASYLELAMRAGIPLATLDARLRNAAASIGVPLPQ